MKRCFITDEAPFLLHIGFDATMSANRFKRFQ